MKTIYGAAALLLAMEGAQAGYAASDADAQVRINQVQVIGSHNSYQGLTAAVLVQILHMHHFEARLQHHIGIHCVPEGGARLVSGASAASADLRAGGDEAGQAAQHSTRDDA